MALVDGKIRTGRRSTKRRALGAAGSRWSDAQKIEAVSLFLTLGNVPLTAATLRIPEETLRYWRQCEWWKEVEGEIKLQDQIQFSATAKKVIDKSLSTVLDRLEHGDWIYDQKTGKMVRKPVAMKDALNAANTMMDKKIILDKQHVQEVSDASIDEKLNKLMDRFAAIAEGKPAPVVQVTDVVFVEGHSPTSDIDSEENDDALHEEWEEGLQEGERAVQQPSGANQETFGTDGSPETE